MRRRIGLLVLVGALGLVATPRARALELRLGVKGALTLSGMIGVESAQIPLAPWHDSSVGAGFGGGLYADLRFNKLIGLELDVLVEGNRLFFDALENVNPGVAILNQALVYEQLRLPLLFKLVANLSEHVEFTGAVGPEVLIGLGATPHSALIGADDLDSNYTADPQSGLALCAAFGFGFLTKYLHFPVELRFSYNVLGAYSYRDRVEQTRTEFEVQSVENFQLALVAGFGFRIPPERPPAPVQVVAKPVEVDDPFYYPPAPEQ